MPENEERKELPVFRFKQGLALGGDPIEIKLDCVEPVKSGEGKYGTWNLWFGFVENAKVQWGRGKDTRDEDDYSGKVLFFPSEKLNEDLIEAADGKVNTVVSVKKTAQEGKKGLITKYVVERLKEGEVSSQGMTPGEVKLLEQTQKLLDEGYDIAFEDFVESSKEDEYGKISPLRARKLFDYLKR